ncbi:MAG: hypothetical protein U0939_22765 [Pirellulales bacterium]
MALADEELTATANSLWENNVETGSPPRAEFVSVGRRHETHPAERDGGRILRPDRDDAQWYTNRVARRLHIAKPRHKDLGDEGFGQALAELEVLDGVVVGDRGDGFGEAGAEVDFEVGQLERRGEAEADVVGLRWGGVAEVVGKEGVR